MSGMRETEEHEGTTPGLRAMGNGAAWLQRQTRLSFRSHQGLHSQGSQPQAWPETSQLKLRVSSTCSKQTCPWNIATHLRVWAARPGQSGFTLASSILSPGVGPERGLEKTEEHVTGTQHGHTQGQGPSAHSRDNKAWLCVFYSFQYLPNPEGSLGHKVLWGEKHRRQEVDVDILSRWHQ